MISLSFFKTEKTQQPPFDPSREIARGGNPITPGAWKSLPPWVSPSGHGVNSSEAIEPIFSFSFLLCFLFSLCREKIKENHWRKNMGTTDLAIPENGKNFDSILEPLFSESRSGRAPCGVDKRGVVKDQFGWDLSGGSWPMSLFFSYFFLSFLGR